MMIKRKFLKKSDFLMKNIFYIMKIMILVKEQKKKDIKFIFSQKQFYGT